MANNHPRNEDREVMYTFRYYREEQSEGYSVFIPHFRTSFYWPEGDSLEYAREAIAGRLGHDMFTFEEIEDAD